MLNKISKIGGMVILSKRMQSTVLGGDRVVFCNSDADCAFNCGKCSSRFNVCRFPTGGCA